MEESTRPQNFWVSRSGVGPEICMSHKFSGDATAAGPGCLQSREVTLFLISTSCCLGPSRAYEIPDLPELLFCPCIWFQFNSVRDTLGSACTCVIGECVYFSHIAGPLGWMKMDGSWFWVLPASSGNQGGAWFYAYFPDWAGIPNETFELMTYLLFHCEFLKISIW